MKNIYKVICLAVVVSSSLLANCAIADTQSVPVTLTVTNQTMAHLAFPRVTLDGLTGIDFVSGERQELTLNQNLYLLLYVKYVDHLFVSKNGYGVIHLSTLSPTPTSEGRESCWVDVTISTDDAGISGLSFSVTGSDTYDPDCKDSLSSVSYEGNNVTVVL